MAPPRSPRMQSLIYLVLVLAFSSFFYFLILHSGSLGNGRGMYVLGLMWCPALEGMLTLRLNGRSISELGWKWGQTKYQIQSWLIPLLVYRRVWLRPAACRRCFCCVFLDEAARAAGVVARYGDTPQQAVFCWLAFKADFQR